MAFSCFTGGSKQHKRPKHTPLDGLPWYPETEKEMSTFLRRCSLEDELAVICWTAPFLSLDSSIHSIAHSLAKQHMGIAKFAVCNVDILHKQAHEYEIASLPTFLIFDQLRVVERLEGLSSSTFISPLLDYYANISEATGAMSTQSTPRHSRSHSNDSQMSRDSAESDASGSVGSLPDHGQMSGEWVADHMLKLSESTSEERSTFPERFYLPKFTKGRRRGLEGLNWRSRTELGVYMFN